MLDAVFDFLKLIENFFWGYVAFILIMVLGTFLTLKTRFFQFRQFPTIKRTFFEFLGSSCQGQRGVHPLKVFFASVGGMIGIGNVVGVATAIQFGGPGALFWVWVAGIIGAIVKYGEIYLGLKYRVENARGGYDGGPMYFLKQAFNIRILPFFVAVLLCIYGVEIYQFSVITDSVSTNWGFHRYGVVLVLLALILWAGVGGVRRIGKICSWIMPFFVVTYVGMILWVLIQEAPLIPALLATVFKSAFTGHAAIGGFAGSSVILAIQHGISRAAYSADIGIGYDSIIQSESSTTYPERQARLAILGVCVDNLVCTMTILLILVSGVWKAIEPIPGSQIVQTALDGYFPHMEVFMPIFLGIAGYSTMIAYFCVGLKCARFLSPKYGTPAYILYGILALIFFSFFDQSQALLIMSIAGAMLLMINLLGIFRLRDKIPFLTLRNDDLRVVDEKT